MCITHGSIALFPSSSHKAEQLKDVWRNANVCPVLLDPQGQSPLQGVRQHLPLQPAKVSTHCLSCPPLELVAPELPEPSLPRSCSGSSSSGANSWCLAPLLTRPVPGAGRASHNCPGSSQPPAFCLSEPARQSCISEAGMDAHAKRL